MEERRSGEIQSIRPDIAEISLGHMPQSSTRPPFEPLPVPVGVDGIEDGANRKWVSVIQCAAHFPVELVSEEMLCKHN